MGLWEDLYKSEHSEVDGSFEEFAGISEPSAPRGSEASSYSLAGRSGGDTSDESREIVGIAVPRAREVSSDDNFQRGAEGFGEDDFIERKDDISDAASSAQAKTQTSPTEYNNSVSSILNSAQVPPQRRDESGDVDYGQFSGAIENYNMNWIA